VEPQITGALNLNNSGITSTGTITAPQTLPPAAPSKEPTHCYWPINLRNNHTTTISAPALSTPRTASIPVLSANDTFVFANQSQTLTNKTLTDSNTLFQMVLIPAKN